LEQSGGAGREKEKVQRVRTYNGTSDATDGKELGEVRYIT
jgi:hypothetical protein